MAWDSPILGNTVYSNESKQKSLGVFAENRRNQPKYSWIKNHSE